MFMDSSEMGVGAGWDLTLASLLSPTERSAGGALAGTAGTRAPTAVASGAILKARVAE